MKTLAAVALAAVLLPASLYAQTARRLTAFPPGSFVEAVGTEGTRYFFVQGEPWSVMVPMNRGLWITDGTGAGTIRVKDLAPAQTWPVPLEAVALDGRLFFSVRADQDPLNNTRDTELLMVSDGTEVGTSTLDSQLMYTCFPSPTFWPGIHGLTAYQERVFYRRADTIWSTDGSMPVVQAAFAEGCRGLPRPSLIAAGAFLHGPKGRDIVAGMFPPPGVDAWRTDGTPAGTAPALDGEVAAADFTAFAGRAFFSARDATQGSVRALWSTDGGPAVRVAVFPGKHVSAGPGGKALLAVGSRLYFVVGANQLWVTDGTPGAERLVSAMPNLALLYAWGDRLVFREGSNPAARLWLVDSTDMLIQVGQFASIGTEYAPFEGRLYFACATVTPGAAELCWADGMPAGTGVVDLGPGSANPRGFIPLAQRLLFTVDDPQQPAEDRQVWTLGDVPILSVNDVSVSEPVSGTATASFTVELSPAAGGVTTVAYQTSDGSARAGEDYDASSGILTFMPGQNLKTVDVTVRRDNHDAPPTNFYLNLSNAAGATIVRARGVGTILDIDPTPSLTVNDPVVTEGTGVGGTAAFVITLSAASEFPVEVHASTNADPDKTGQDFEFVFEVVTFPPGVTQRTVLVPIIGDAKDEPNEAFLLVLDDVQNATLAKRAGQATILDDDGRTATCRPVAYLPFVISGQGRYCLDRNLSTAITTGAAISIETDFVDLDLRGFKIGGGSAGLGTLTDGVRATSRRNITVRNGNIRGFFRGVAITDGSVAAVVENLRLDDNTVAGIMVEGTGHTVRRNSIVATGGTTLTVGAGSPSLGISASTGSGVRILNNDVTDTIGVGSGGSLSISVLLVDESVIEGNRVGLGAMAANTVGIRITGSGASLVARNRIVRTESGIVFYLSSGSYRDNLTSGVAIPYTGGTDAGGNN